MLIVSKGRSFFVFLVALGVVLTAYVFTSTNDSEDGQNHTQTVETADVKNIPADEPLQKNLTPEGPSEEKILINNQVKNADPTQVAPATEEQIEAEQNERAAATKRFAKIKKKRRKRRTRKRKKEG